MNLVTSFFCIITVVSLMEIQVRKPLFIIIIMSDRDSEHTCGSLYCCIILAYFHSIWQNMRFDFSCLSINLGKRVDVGLHGRSLMNLANTLIKLHFYLFHADSRLQFIFKFFFCTARSAINFLEHKFVMCMHDVYVFWIAMTQLIA